MKKTLLLSFLFFLACASYAQQKDKPYVVLVSLDGFRWDYHTYFDTPNLDKIANEGVKAKSMKPSYPTKTFPNHYSIVTGLYPDNNGIVNNSFYDPKLKMSFSLSSIAKTDARFYGGNPIWNVAEQQGIKTASFYWPGSDIGDRSPSIFKTYDASVPYATRIETVIDWLKLPEKERPHLITLYFDEPDYTGHTFGPLSKENKITVHKMDSIIGSLSMKLEELSIGKQINLIVVSDHGMTDISDKKKVAVLKYLKPSWLEYADVINPIMSIRVRPEAQDSVFKALRRVPHIRFWKTDNIPKRLHYGTNDRSLDFVIEAKKGYSLVKESSQKVKGGTHGYDNRVKDMHAIFYAKGPDFKVNKKVRTLKNVSVYNLIAHILGLQIETVDGDFKEVKRMLKE
ncbi:ectonucleotide pyrophosphatase/phosphodiesterase [Flavobacterium sp. K5-23]|uniref:alkaline phosphatase family protein n=1 Tax=Flavobacterium sp. K5-23 TaxID=2746225 RepID=UPI0020103FCA|nr:ectonucleotide pyrophosphatase/phosphodiesterase [Flavobacterium sp. K5-23]UQD56325.1 alkaline phosphatase family protein [Flavobacterium sp. K5-23]